MMTKIPMGNFTGPSNYARAVALGEFTGTEAQYLASLKGEPGDITPAALAAKTAAESARDTAVTAKDQAVAAAAAVPGLQEDLDALEASLPDTYATPDQVTATVGSAVAPKLDKTEAASAYQPISPSRTFGALIRALRALRSTALIIFGDSTGDSDGSSAAADRLAARFVRRLAERFPSHHVLFKLWNPTTEDYGAWVVMQAQAAGRRFVNITTRSIRYVFPDITKAQYTSGNIDAQALVSFSTLSGATGTIITQAYKEVGGVRSADQVFEVRLHTSGNLYMRHSQDGVNWLSDRISTVPLSSVAQVGVPIWVRATLEIVVGTGFTVKFYTSPDRITWTQLGAAVTGGSASTTAIHQPSQGSYVEAGASGWQPVGSPLTGAKIYEVQVRDGVDGPTLAPAAIETWERYADANTTYGGAPTLYVLNASRSGSNMTYHTDPTRLKKETQNYGQVAAIFNDSHNEGGNTGSLWIPAFTAWVNAVLGRLPNAAVNVVGQNPHTSAWANETAFGPEHVTRIMELSAAASNAGWGFVNVYQAYLDDPRGLSVLVSADGLHPSPVPGGYALTGDVVAAEAGIR